MKQKLKDFFQSQIIEHELVVEKIKNNLESSFLNVVNICFNAIKREKKIIFFGNGGSASDAQHLSTELTVRFSENRKPISAISLSTDTSTLTAVGNDFGFEYIFSRQLEALGMTGDVAIGISTSGKSKNVIKGLEYAKKNRMKSIIFTGRNIKLVEKITDEIISIPAKNTSRIQEAHILLGQMLCNALEYKLGLAKLVKEEKK
ncbi:MAG: phosphoheptose isomerase [Rickettsiales bacterium]|nr:phosphoheptose isomerase [Rickettsiales bacterium]OUV54894.1 MAG: phosphoheptose isomerase [Rickettsiales bacterium TMED127]|tara:strand:+ start:35835 stop:36443 length:609 start_codon:yes stop_codon:yes gene_type:complete